MLVNLEKLSHFPPGIAMKGGNPVNCAAVSRPGTLKSEDQYPEGGSTEIRWETVSKDSFGTCKTIPVTIPVAALPPDFLFSEIIYSLLSLPLMYWTVRFFSSLQPKASPRFTRLPPLLAGVLSESSSGCSASGSSACFWLLSLFSHAFLFLGGHPLSSWWGSLETELCMTAWVHPELRKSESDKQLLYINHIRASAEMALMNLLAGQQWRRRCRQGLVCGGRGGRGRGEPRENNDIHTCVPAGHAREAAVHHGSSAQSSVMTCRAETGWGARGRLQTEGICVCLRLIHRVCSRS